MRAKNGGPAFPGARVIHRDIYEELKEAEGVNRAREIATYEEPGMTLRDYVATHVVGAFAVGADDVGKFDADDVRDQASEVARIAYAIADAMIAERDR